MLCFPINNIAAGVVFLFDHVRMRRPGSARPVRSWRTLSINFFVVDPLQSYILVRWKICHMMLISLFDKVRMRKSMYGYHITILSHSVLFRTPILALQRHSSARSRVQHLDGPWLILFRPACSYDSPFDCHSGGGGGGWYKFARTKVLGIIDVQYTDTYKVCRWSHGV